VKSKAKLGLTLLGLECLGGAVACLPDPRPYDACIDTQSYYAVSPVGCNGHGLSQLGERKATREYDGYVPVESDIEIDATDIYWVGPDGEVLRTSKSAETTEVVSFPEVRPSSVQLELDRDRLYIWRMTAGAGEAISTDELVIVDTATSQAEIIATAPAWRPPRLQLFNGIAYANTGGTEPCLRRISRDSTAQSCVFFDYVEQFEVTDWGTYFLSSNATGRAVRFLPQGADAPTTIATVPAEVVAFDVQDDRVRWLERDNTSSAVRMGDGSGETGKPIRIPGQLNAVTFSDAEMYGVGWLDENSTVPRLYVLRPSSLVPQTIAASLTYATALKADDSHVYAAVLTFDNEENTPSTSLFRIER
jgi:hypothetical protein